MKIIEDNLLLEEEYEDEEFSTVYENKEESVEKNEKAPSDEELDKIFKHRRQVLRRGCSVIKKIQDLMSVGSFESLLHLHRTIYDVSQPIPDSWMKSGDCIPDNLPQSSVRLVGDPFKILICLPPKCGTTNWQRGMNTLHYAISGKQREPESFYPPSLYSKLLVLSTKQIGNGKNRSMKWENKVANTRNPFARLFSAWNDKGRTHLDEQGDVSFEDFSGARILALVEEGKIGEAKMRMKGIIADKAHHFHAPYWAGIKPFQTSPPSPGRNSSFPGTDLNFLSREC
ncbi:unnamed protein product [Oikopleura dioica]|uniref:Carbohydrate sulfotransferase n=1 Tax=Oikopleura dioica TaxID=34765 RepID=E4YII9_OIKDI|nr:unnamed protein product [Oikopleura dioica]